MARKLQCNRSQCSAVHSFEVRFGTRKEEILATTLTSLLSKMNETTRKALEDGLGLCLSRTHYDIEVEHFLMKRRSRSLCAPVVKHQSGTACRCLL